MTNSSQTFANCTVPEGVWFILEAVMKGVLAENFNRECTTVVNR
jgi:hypothetical protein